MTGPRPSSLPRRISTSASSRDHVACGLVGGRRDSGSSRASGHRPRNWFSRSAGIQKLACGAFETSDALVARQRVEPFAPAGRGAGLGFGQAAQPQQRVMQLLGVDGIGPGLGLNLGDRLRIQPAKVGRALADRASAAP